MHRRVGGYDRGGGHEGCSGTGGANIDGLDKSELRGEPAVPADDSVSDEEAMAQVSVWILAQVFLSLDYAPFLRMVAVAILHPLSPADIRMRGTKRGETGGSEYAITQALNAIVRGQCVLSTRNGSRPERRVAHKDSKPQRDDNADSDDNQGNCARHGEDDAERPVEAVANLYRRALVSILRGDMGDRRFIPAAMLLQSVLDSEHIDGDVLTALEVFPDYFSPSRTEGGIAGSSSTGSSYDSPFEDALATFFLRTGRPPSSSSTLAMECCGALTLSMLSHLVAGATLKGTDFDQFHGRFCSSTLVRGLVRARAAYAAEGQKLRSAASVVSEMFMDLFEFEISRRYRESEGNNGKKFLMCSLVRFGLGALQSDPEVFACRARDVNENEIELAKFNIRMVLHFRSLCKVLVEVDEKLSCIIGPHSMGSRWGQDSLKIQKLEVADELLMALGGFQERPEIGTDLDVRGRTFFYFSPFSPQQVSPQASHESRNSFSSRRKRAENLLARATMPQIELMLVVDPTEIFVLKPYLPGDGPSGDNRGKILYSAPLRSIIAAVADKEHLHIAIRQMENIEPLIRNGNMSLRFDGSGTTLIVRQYLERCRSALRSKLLRRVDSLFSECAEDLFPLDDKNSIDYCGEMPMVGERMDITLDRDELDIPTLTTLSNSPNGLAELALSSGVDSIAV